MTSTAEFSASIEARGYCLLDQLVSSAECEQWCNKIDDAFSGADTGPLRTGTLRPNDEGASKTFGVAEIVKIFVKTLRFEVLDAISYLFRNKP